MGGAEIISLSEVRARKQWDGLRQELHARFDQWLDNLEACLPEPTATLPEASDLVWQLRQDLTGGLTETLLSSAHASEQSRQQAPCPQCERLTTARPAATRTVEPMVGAMKFERPYFYCRRCKNGFYPFDSALNLAPGHLQLDVQQRAAKSVAKTYQGAYAMTQTTPLYDENGKRLYLTAGERDAFRDAAMNEDRTVRLFCHLLYYAGPRISEKPCK